MRLRPRVRGPQTGRPARPLERRWFHLSTLGRAGRPVCGPRTLGLNRIAKTAPGAQAQARAACRRPKRSAGEVRMAAADDGCPAQAQRMRRWQAGKQVVHRLRIQAKRACGDIHPSRHSRFPVRGAANHCEVLQRARATLSSGMSLWLVTVAPSLLAWRKRAERASPPTQRVGDTTASRRHCSTSRLSLPAKKIFVRFPPAAGL